MASRTPDAARDRIPAKRRDLSPAKLLADAARVAGDRAVIAAGRNNYAASRRWATIAVEINGLTTRTVEEMARSV